VSSTHEGADAKYENVDKVITIERWMKVFNFGIAKILATTEITKFHEIQLKFQQIFLETST